MVSRLIVVSLAEGGGTVLYGADGVAYTGRLHPEQSFGILSL